MAQGGDRGSAICAWLGLEHSTGVRTSHLTYLLVQPASGPETTQEKAWHSAPGQAQQTLGAYALLYATNPVAQAA